MYEKIPFISRTNQNTTDQQDFPTNKTELKLLHTLEDFLRSTQKRKKEKKKKKGERTFWGHP
jgi:hypothetical protein